MSDTPASTVPMALARKICLIGDFGVGKTSLVARFVRQTFSERYLSTVGVKIDTRQLTLDDGSAMKLVIWDIAGGLDATQSHPAFLQGVAGALLVVDGTRAPTLQTALTLRDRLLVKRSDLPCIGLINKSDLSAQWELNADVLEHTRIPWLAVSAKSGENVELAFKKLASQLKVKP